MRGEELRDWSDSEQQAAPKPRGRPRKSVPQQAAATSEEPTKGVPKGQRRPLDQDSKQISEQDYYSFKRPRGAAEDEVASAGQDADNEQEHLPAKRKRTPLFSMQDIIAAEKGDSAEALSALHTNPFAQQQQQQQQQGGLPPPGASSRPSSRQQPHPGPQVEQDWSYLFQQQQQQQGRYTASPSPAAAGGVEVAAPAVPAAAGPSAGGAGALPALPAFQQQSPTLPLTHPAAAPAAPGTDSRAIYGSTYGPVDPAAASAGGAAMRSSVEDIQQQIQQQRFQGPLPPHQQQQRLPPPAEFNPELLPKGAQRDMALQRERRVLAEAAQCELGPDSLGPDTNVATLVQRILKCGVLTRKTVEYRKRAKGLVPADYNRGTITSAGLIRCSCHGQDITMSEFEQHSNSQIHRPAEYIFIKSVDMSLKGFANLVLQKPIESNLWYCLACNEGGDLLCCDGCPAAFHTACLVDQPTPQNNQEWLCAECVMAGKKPRWSATGPLRRQVPLAGAAGTAGGSSTGGSSSMRRSNASSSATGRAAARGSSSDVVVRKSSGGYGGSSAGMNAANTAGAAAAAAGSSAVSYGQQHLSHPGSSHPAAAVPMTHPYYESDEPHMAAAASAGMSNAYAGMSNPPPPPPGAGAPWVGRSQGLPPVGISPEPQHYPGTGGFPQGLQPGNTRGFSSSGYDQGLGFPGPHRPLYQGSARYDDFNQGIVSGHLGAGGFNGLGPPSRSALVKPEADLFGLNVAGAHQQQQQQGSIEQILHQLAGGNGELLQLVQKHLQSGQFAAASGNGLEQQQQQQQWSDSRHAGAHTPSLHASPGSGINQQQPQLQQQFSPQYESQQQQQRPAVVARKGSSTSDPAAAAAAPVTQLQPLPPGSPQQQHLAALAAAAAAEAATMPTQRQQQQQQQDQPSSEAFAAAGAGATAAQLISAALKASSAPVDDDVLGQIIPLVQLHLEQQQSELLGPTAGAGSGAVAVAALLQMFAAAASGQHQGQGQQQQQQHPSSDPAAAAPAAGPQMVPATEAAAATADDGAKANGGVAREGQPAVAAAAEPTAEGDVGLTTAATGCNPGAPASESQQPQQLQVSEERRAAIAAALQAGSSLVSNVLGAQTLAQAQRAVAAAGAQLLASLGGLL